jgi:hypothetical protein
MTFVYSVFVEIEAGQARRFRPPSKSAARPKFVAACLQWDVKYFNNSADLENVG